MSERNMTIQDLLVGILKRLYKNFKSSNGKKFQIFTKFQDKEVFLENSTRIYVHQVENSKFLNETTC